MLVASVVHALASPSGCGCVCRKCISKTMMVPGLVYVCASVLFPWYVLAQAWMHHLEAGSWEELWGLTAVAALDLFAHGVLTVSLVETRFRVFDNNFEEAWADVMMQKAKFD